MADLRIHKITEQDLTKDITYHQKQIKYHEKQIHQLRIKMVKLLTFTKVCPTCKGEGYTLYWDDADLERTHCMKCEGTGVIE